MLDSHDLQNTSFLPYPPKTATVALLAKLVLLSRAVQIQSLHTFRP